MTLETRGSSSETQKLYKVTAGGNPTHGSGLWNGTLMVRFFKGGDDGDDCEQSRLPHNSLSEIELICFHLTPMTKRIDSESTLNESIFFQQISADKLSHEAQTEIPCELKKINTHRSVVCVQLHVLCDDVCPTL